MNTTNPKLNNVEQSFASVGATGESQHFNGEPWVANMVQSHVQGIARYDKYYLLTHNNKGYSTGYIMELNIPEENYLSKIDTPDEHYNHPSGFQIIGDVMAVPIENSDASASVIRFYQIKNSGTGLQLFSYSINRSNKGAGALGITNFTVTDKDTNTQTEYYLLAVYDNGATDFYISNGQALLSENFEFNGLFSVDFDNTGFSSLCLVTDTNEKIYAFGFWVEGSVSYTDKITLYSVDYSGSHKGVKKLSERHMTTVCDGIQGIDGVHFRWGAGLQVLSSTELNFFATQRNFVGNNYYTNIFS